MQLKYHRFVKKYFVSSRQCFDVPGVSFSFRRCIYVEQCELIIPWELCEAGYELPFFRFYFFVDKNKLNR